MRPKSEKAILFLCSAGCGDIGIRFHLFDPASQQAAQFAGQARPCFIRLFVCLFQLVRFAYLHFQIFETYIRSFEELQRFRRRSFSAPFFKLHLGGLNHQTDDFLHVPAYAGGKHMPFRLLEFLADIMRVEVEVFQLGQQGEILQRH